jgi:hypothetical protein
MLSLIYVANKLFMLSVTPLNVAKLNVVILSVVAPSVEPLYFMTYKQSESSHNQVKIS